MNTETVYNDPDDDDIGVVFVPDVDFEWAVGPDTVIVFEPEPWTSDPQ